MAKPNLELIKEQIRLRLRSEDRNDPITEALKDEDILGHLAFLVVANTVSEDGKYIFELMRDGGLPDGSKLQQDLECLTIGSVWFSVINGKKIVVKTVSGKGAFDNVTFVDGDEKLVDMPVPLFLGAMTFVKEKDDTVPVAVEKVGTMSFVEAAFLLAQGKTIARPGVTPLSLKDYGNRTSELVSRLSHEDLTAKDWYEVQK